VRKWEVELTLIEAWMNTVDDEEYDNLIAALEQLETSVRCSPSTHDRGRSC